MNFIGLCAFSVWNMIVLTLYGVDKFKSMQNRRRISEKTLILCAFLMGGLGALVGMYSFRHKIRKIRFNILVPVALFVNLGVLWLLERI